MIGARHTYFAASGFNSAGNILMIGCHDDALGT